MPTASPGVELYTLPAAARKVGAPLASVRRVVARLRLGQVLNGKLGGKGSARVLAEHELGRLEDGLIAAGCLPPAETTAGL